MTNGKRPLPLLWLILGAYVLITVGYGVVNPLFEAPDEHFHFFTIHQLTMTGELPVISFAETELEFLGPEPAQPPLYYVLAALVSAPIEYADARDQVWLNPYAWIGSADAVVNVNRAIVTPQQQWPWTGYALAAHIMRLFSTLLGLGTLLCVYGNGRLLWPDDVRPALLATALLAFLPQFNFIHAAVTNDALITFLCALGLWQILRLWLDGVTNGRFLLLGVTIGFAALSKNAGFLLWLYSLGVVGLIWLRGLELETWKLEIMKWKNLQLLIANLLLASVPVLLIAGWLWWRNYQLYGDFTAANQFILIAGGDRGYSLLAVLGEWQGLWLSLFALFGWFNLRPPDWIFWVWNGMVLTAVLGTVITLWRKIRRVGDGRVVLKRLFQSPIAHLHERWFTAVLLFIWFMLVYAGLVTFMMQTPAAQGRLLFPALIPLIMALTYGLVQLAISYEPFAIGNKPFTIYHLTLPLLALTTTLYSLFFVIRPAYTRPQVVTDLPETAVSTPNYDVGFGLKLIGAEVGTTTAVPGDVIAYTLYWQADNVPPIPPELKIEMLGMDEENPDGETHAYHGRGLYPASLWPQGKQIAEETFVRLYDDIDAPVLSRGYAYLVAPQEMADWIGPPAVEIGAVKIVPHEWPKPAGAPLALIGDRVALTAVAIQPLTAQPGDTITITVQWHVLAPPAAHWTTLIHLAEPNQPPYAAGDRPPRQGHYPTQVWETGEVINDEYQLVVPEALGNGRYPLWLGMYDSETIARLPLTVDDQRQPNDVYQIGWVELGNADNRMLP